MVLGHGMAFEVNCERILLRSVESGAEIFSVLIFTPMWVCKKLTD